MVKVSCNVVMTITSVKGFRSLYLNLVFFFIFKSR
uniref:Uncharacterized protein n=1 Tax=Setaria italica TaxID=4555 RepID=K3ZFM2_SETIT